MKDIAKFIGATVEELDKLKGVKIERAKLGPCPVCGKEIVENRKGYSCWSREDPGCGFVIWKQKARKNLPVSVAKELMASLKESLERGDEPPIGRTAKQVTGFKGRSGRSFRAKLKIERREDDPNRWKVEFDEEWATMSAKEREEAAAAAEEAIAAGNGDGKQEIAETAEPQRAAS
jgi:DNA topoisomerase-3